VDARDVREELAEETGGRCFAGGGSVSSASGAEVSTASLVSALVA
jgi:hypothetical protein